MVSFYREDLDDLVAVKVLNECFVFVLLSWSTVKLLGIPHTVLHDYVCEYNYY